MVATASPTRQVISPDLANRVLSGEIAVIDVRTTSEYRAGHVPRSINIPMDEVESRLEDIPKGLPVLMVCQSGRRSEIVRGRIHGKLDQLSCIDGGLNEWVKAGLPVVKSTRTRMALDRQSMIGASLLVLTSVALGTLISPAWYFLALLPGVGLMLAGTTGFCLMGIILSTMPWNKARSRI